MTPVPAIKDLSPFVMGFSGKDISETLKLAEEWAKRHKVTLSNYYVQIHGGGRSIIASVEEIKASTA